MTSINWLRKDNIYMIAKCNIEDVTRLVNLAKLDQIARITCSTDSDGCIHIDYRTVSSYDNDAREIIRNIMASSSNIKEMLYDELCELLQALKEDKEILKFDLYFNCLVTNSIAAHTSSISIRERKDGTAKPVADADNEDPIKAIEKLLGDKLNTYTHLCVKNHGNGKRYVSVTYEYLLGVLEDAVNNHLDSTEEQ